VPEDWTAIAAEVAEALADVGFAATIEQPGILSDTNGDVTEGEPTLHTVTVIDDMIRRRDAGGMVTETVRVLTVATGVVVPVKGWRAQVRGTWHRIAAVKPLAPGGVDLLFDVELEG
jgi:hypothetical protein